MFGHARTSDPRHTIFGKLLLSGGAHAFVAESLLLKRQLLFSNPSGHRASNLITFDRLVRGLTTLFLNPDWIRKCGALIKPVLKAPPAANQRVNTAFLFEESFGQLCDYEPEVAAPGTLREVRSDD